MAAHSRLTKLFTHFASSIAHAAGRPLAFILCCAIPGWNRPSDVDRGSLALDGPWPFGRELGHELFP